MAQAKGTASVDFGGTPCQVTRLTVAAADIASGDFIEAWFQGTDSTADHNAYHHAVMLPLFARATAENLIPATSFDLVVASELSTTGVVKVRWARAT